VNNALVRLLQYFLPRRFWYRRFYLRSKHWREIRFIKLSSVGYRCEKCMTHSERGYDVHHLTYANIWHEKLSDLQVLCRHCHKLEHA